MMTDEDTMRLLDLLVLKYRKHVIDVRDCPIDDDTLRDLIGGVIVDTDMVSCGTLSLDAWESASWVEAARARSRLGPRGDNFVIVADDPPAAELIPDLDWIQVIGMFGVPLSEKKQERERAKIAADLTAEGRPFIWHGIRHGPPA